MTIPSIDAQRLYATLGLRAAPVLLDVRPPEKQDGRLLPGARIVAAERVGQWLTQWPAPNGVVLYCRSGGDISQDCTQRLAARGTQATFLEGGIEAWQKAGLATVRARAEWNAPGASRWVTRERPKIDRLACPWLVRRFIDPDAQFFYTAAHRVRADAETLQGVPYDIADVTFSHRGPKCSFDAFLDEFDLHDPVVDELALIVRAADTAQLALSPQAPGLLAISLGLSASITDDIVLLEQAMPIYDALYAWCKSAREETHSWPQATRSIA